MFKPSDFEIHHINYIWKDNENLSKDTPPTVYTAPIAIGSSKLIDFLLEKIEQEDPEWEDFDSGILAYLDSDRGETLESLYNFDSSYEFMAVEAE